MSSIHIHLHKHARDRKSRRTKDVDVVKCWDCGERFPPGTTIYPPHRAADGSRCPMSGRPVPTDALDRKRRR